MSETRLHVRIELELQAEITKLSQRCDDLLTTGNALAEQLDAARGVIRDYHETCDCIISEPCEICQKADSLLTKPEGTR